MHAKPCIDIVIPVFNNSDVLEWSIMKQVEFYRKHLQGYGWRIIIADNASRDRTPDIGKSLAARYPEVTYSFIQTQGRGIALRTAWSKSSADYVSYMDVDLATDLEAVPKLLGHLDGGADVAVGSKYIAGAVHKRRLNRYILSRGYNWLTSFLLKTKFTDAQCGFKSLTKKAADRILPLIKDDFWFFDTELLYFAEKLGMHTTEVPVQWEEGRKSGVKLFKTTSSFLKNLLELRKRPILR
ncbi:glycosyltransferase [Candidatus Woesearchaeota archaeon]|nr:glycosyltransferase [Candidatus Woesearchaeota archaeon]